MSISIFMLETGNLLGDFPSEGDAYHYAEMNDIDPDSFILWEN